MRFKDFFQAWVERTKKYRYLPALFLIVFLQFGIAFILLGQIKKDQSLSKSIFSAGNETDDQNRFCFAHITDVHADKSASGLTNGPDKEFANRFLKSLTYFSTTFKTPFILDAGDTVTEINNFPMFLKIAELSAIKIYSTPGNHDYSIADISSNNLVKKKKLVFDYFGYRFIGIDSLNVDFSWLDNELAAGRQAGKKIILFGHLPVEWPTQLTHQLINMEDTVREKIKKRMVDYDVLAYLSGHLHEPFTSKTLFQSGEKTGEIRNLGGPSLGHKKAYQLICLDNDNITNYPVEFDSPLPITLTPIPDAQRTTVNLQQRLNGYSGNKDSQITLYKETVSSSETTLKVGYKQQNAALIYFDLSALPANIKVESAKYSVYAAGWSGNPNPLEIINVLGVYPLKRQWIDTQATYYKPLNGSSWGLPGCNDTLLDREAYPKSFNLINAIGKWYDFDLTQTVQSWIDNPLANNGFILKQALANNPDNLYFASSENSNYPPKLSITYSENTFTETAPVPSLIPTTTVASPSASPTPTQAPIFNDCSSACNSDLYLYNNQTSSNLVYLNNQDNYYVFFKPATETRIKEIEVLVGQWGNAPRSASCKITDEAGNPVMAEKSTAAFTSGFSWQKISLANLNFDQRTLLQSGKNYRLYCRGPDSWNSIFWKGGNLNTDPRAAKILVSPCCGQENVTPTPSSVPTSQPTIAPSPTPPISSLPEEVKTVSFRQNSDGYRGLIDTSLSWENPDSQFCSSSLLKIGYKMRNSALFYFDLSSLPANATIESAVLSLYASGWGGNNLTLGIYRVLTGWGCSVTWNSGWNSPGCSYLGGSDRETNPSITLTTSNIKKWYDFNLTSLVQSWVTNPDQNKGILLQQIGNDTNLFYFNSSENGSNQPVLVVKYR